MERGVECLIGIEVMSIALTGTALDVLVSMNVVAGMFSEMPSLQKQFIKLCQDGAFLVENTPKVSSTSHPILEGLTYGPHSNKCGHPRKSTSRRRWLYVVTWRMYWILEVISLTTTTTIRVGTYYETIAQ